MTLKIVSIENFQTFTPPTKSNKTRAWRNESEKASKSSTMMEVYRSKLWAKMFYCLFANKTESIFLSINCLSPHHCSFMCRLDSRSFYALCICEICRVIIRPNWCSNYSLLFEANVKREKRKFWEGNKSWGTCHV